jgi:hypothetical protein
MFGWQINIVKVNIKKPLQEVFKQNIFVVQRGQMPLACKGQATT